MTPFRQNFIIWASALLLLVFLYTGLSKLLERTAFEVALANAPVIEKYAVILSIAIPVIEIIIALLLLLPAFRFVGLLASAFLLFAFTCYIIYLFLYAKEMPCRCGGVVEKMTWSQHMVFNLALLALNMFAIYFIGIDRSSRRPVEDSRHISE